jgi:hypothetical protein
MISKKNKISFYSIFIISLFILVLFMVRIRNTERLSTILNFIRYIMVFIFVIIMSSDEKKKIVDLTTVFYSIIIIVSIVAYLLVIAGIGLPYSIITKEGYNSYPPFLNYKLFIAQYFTGPSTYTLFQRFQSIFTEPGHLGMISSFLLYINHYELKRKSVLIIFISVIMSLSLAAYILSVIGYFIQIIANSKNMHKTILKISIIALLLGVMGFYYYTMNPDSTISRIILRRLEFNANRGIRGNNRTTEKFNYYYNTKFLQSTENILLGQKMNEYQFMSLLGYGGNNSYQVFILQYGVISLFLLFFLYFNIVFNKPSRLGYGLLVIYCASFMQRTYALWDMQLFLFIAAIQCFYCKTKIMSIEKVN